MVISNHNSFWVLFDKIACVYFIWKIIYILALKIASAGNQHCANCIGTLSFPNPQLRSSNSTPPWRTLPTEEKILRVEARVVSERWQSVTVNVVYLKFHAELEFIKITTIVFEQCAIVVAVVSLLVMALWACYVFRDRYAPLCLLSL